MIHVQKSVLRSLALAVAIVALASCGDRGERDVRNWMQEVRAQTGSGVPPLAAPKTFTPFPYGGNQSVDPFNPVKLQVALARQQAISGGRLRPDLNRRREPLEAYPLDSLKMVGTLQSAGRKVALIEVDRLVFKVAVGQYVGQNFGMVSRIAEGEVELREVAQDASGTWVERRARLELQESKK